MTNWPYLKSQGKNSNLFHLLPNQSFPPFEMTNLLTFNFSPFSSKNRQGKMCRRCLGGFDDDTLTVPDYASSIACTEDGDDASLNELLQRTNSVQNIYNAAGITANQVIKKVLVKITDLINTIYLTIPTKSHQPLTCLPSFLFSAFSTYKTK